MQWRGRFLEKPVGLGLEQTKYGTYLCQCFMLSSDKLTLKDKD